MEGILFNIQRFCMNDGPGIRTTVFLKGCPLRCMWCHNPESYSAKPELLYNERLCIGCRACVHACLNHLFIDGIHHINREACSRCFRCVQECPSGALTTVGKRYSVEEVLLAVDKDAAYYLQSGGGVTLSGGEPFAQPIFTEALLKALKANKYHTCVETCGYTGWSHIESVLPYTDLFLLDIKETDDERHKLFTGVSLRIIHENLRRLSEAGAAVVLRCPIIPGMNDREEHFEQIAAIAEKNSAVDHIEVEPYHPLGISKAEKLGSTMRYAKTDIPTKTEIADWINRISLLTNKEIRQA